MCRLRRVQSRAAERFALSRTRRRHVLCSERFCRRRAARQLLGFGEEETRDLGVDTCIRVFARVWSASLSRLQSVAHHTSLGFVFGSLCLAGEMKRGVCACIGEPEGKELRLMRSHIDLDHQLESANHVPFGFADSDESRALLDEIGARIVASDRPRAAARLIDAASRRRLRGVG